MWASSSYWLTKIDFTAPNNQWQVSLKKNSQKHLPQYWYKCIFALTLSSVYDIKHICCAVANLDISQVPWLKSMIFHTFSTDKINLIVVLNEEDSWLWLSLLTTCSRKQRGRGSGQQQRQKKRKAENQARSIIICSIHVNDAAVTTMNHQCLNLRS